MTSASFRVALAALVATTLLSGAALAQTYFYSPSNTPTTGTCNVFPWGQTSTRHQHLISAAELGNAPQTITDLAYAACGTGTFNAAQILIRMNHYVGAALTTNFAANLGTGDVTVLNATGWSYPYLAHTFVGIGLTGSFNYDPALGSLLVDIEFCGASGGGSFHRDVNPRAWLNAGTCPSGPTGTAATGALKCRVTVSAGNYLAFGASCGNPQPTMFGSGVPNIGGTATLGISNGLAGALGFYLIGAGATAIDLGPSGAPGCTLYTLPFYALATGFDGSGNAAPFSLGIPLDPALVGGTLEFTGGYLDPAQNALGMLTTNGVTMKIGT